MINLGDKLYYTIDWYDLLILQEEAVLSMDYQLAAQIRDRIIKLQSTKADTYKEVLLDLSKLLDQVLFLTRSDKLLKLIQHYEEERNNRLNSILGKY